MRQSHGKKRSIVTEYASSPLLTYLLAFDLPFLSSSRHFLIITTDIISGEAYLQTLRKRYPHVSLNLLPVNSNPSYDTDQPNLWGQTYDPHLTMGGEAHYGGMLSGDDLNGLRLYLEFLGLEVSVLPLLSICSLQRRAFVGTPSH